MDQETTTTKQGCRWCGQEASTLALWQEGAYPVCGPFCPQAPLDTDVLDAARFLHVLEWAIGKGFTLDTPVGARKEGN